MERQSNYREMLEGRLSRVRERIAAAAARAGRSADDVRLIVVTKTHPAEEIREALALGERDFGENRVQEATRKMEQGLEGARWHLIGHLQRNKAAAAVGRFALIHSVDSARLAEELEARAAAKGVIQPILIELNLAGEKNKTGAPQENLGAILEACAAAAHLKVEGLMTMAPYSENPEAARPIFAALRRELEEMPAIRGEKPKHLSMGMSGDYEVAIEEGATLVRIGTAIMGERQGL